MRFVFNLKSFETENFYKDTMLHPRGVEPDSSVGCVQDLRTGGRWFDPQLGRCFYRGLMTVIATRFRFIPLRLLSILSIRVLWKSSQRLEKNIVQSNG